MQRKLNSARSSRSSSRTHWSAQYIIQVRVRVTKLDLTSSSCRVRLAKSETESSNSRSSPSFRVRDQFLIQVSFFCSRQVLRVRVRRLENAPRMLPQHPLKPIRETARSIQERPPQKSCSRSKQIITARRVMEPYSKRISSSGAAGHRAPP